MVIPVYKEDRAQEVLLSLDSCEDPSCQVVVFFLINQPENASPDIKEVNSVAFVNIEKAINTTKSSWLHPLVQQVNLPRKHAGVGLARKIGMDDAVRWFEQLNNPHGIILCLDADCMVSSNYFVKIHRHFEENPETPGASIHYEHPLVGALPDQNYRAIVNYELFLRYYIHAQRYTGFPHAFQTVGSSMAARSWAYQKQGGMNRRKAGEDFYFLNRIIQLGNFTEIKGCCVVPSPRVSDRVPFGTGKDIGKQIHEALVSSYYTYHPMSFIELKLFFDNIHDYYLNYSDTNRFPKTILSFLKHYGETKNLEHLKDSVKTLNTFLDRFYQWFDAFKIMKYVHYIRDNHHQDVPIQQAIEWLFGEIGLPFSPNSIRDNLMTLRAYDRNME